MTLRALSFDGPTPPTMLHALARTAALDASAGITLLSEDPDGAPETRSYADLADAVWRCASRLQAAGIKAGERVLIVLPTGFEFAETFLGLQLIGAVPVPAYPPAALQQAEVALERLRHIVADAEVRVCLTDRALAPLLGALGGVGRGCVSRVIAVEQLPAGASERLVPTFGDVAFMQYTSGSTGRPKGVVVTHVALMANIVGAGVASGVTSDDRMVSWLPLYHDMGLVGGLLWPIFWNLPLVLMSPMTFLARPVRWLQAISEFGGTLTMAPNFAFARCVQRITPEQREGLDLSSLRLALNGAEPVSPATVEAFQGTFATCGLRPDVVYPCYGLAESVVAVTFSEPGTPVRSEALDRDALAQGRVQRSNAATAIKITCCGRAIPGATVRIVDERGRRVRDRVVGEIVVSGPSLMRGYHGNDEATAAALEDGVLHTGDLGFMDGPWLYVTGRKKDLIIVRGKNVHAEDVETVAEEVEGVRRGRVVAFGIYDDARAVDRIVLVVEGGPADATARESTSEALKARVCEVMGITLDEVVFAPAGAIPKTYSGKRQRQLTRKRYLAGTLGRTTRFATGRVLARAVLGAAFFLVTGLFGSSA